MRDGKGKERGPGEAEISPIVSDMTAGGRESEEGL